MRWISTFLMLLSPHDEEKLEANTEDVRRKIAHREQLRKHAAQQGQDYLDMQLEIMRRK